MLPDRVSNPGPLTYESGVNSEHGFLTVVIIIIITSIVIIIILLFFAIRK